MKFIYSFLLLFPMIQAGCSSQGEVFHKTEMLMGTFVEISCISGDNKTCKAGVDDAFREMKRIEEILSRFKTDSDVSRLNKTSGDLIRVKDETFTLIQKAKMFYQESGGAFDITVSPLLETWGFYNRHSKLSSIPADKIRERLPLVGSDKIIIEESDKGVGFQIPGMAIDLGGIAIGYAVDKAVEVLSKGGIRNALINAGGDIYCLGGGRNNRGWKIGIQHPLKPNEIIAILNLKNRAITTSGQYENFLLIADKRFSHIIDPKTGYPVENDMLSVTVVADACLTADALATAVFVLGPAEGELLLKKFQAEALIISKTDKGLKFWVSEGLKQNLRINY